MHFKMSKEIKNYFNNIISLGGSHGTDDKNKFLMFDVYYCCALLGIAARELDDDKSDLADMIQGYPTQYKDCRSQIAGLLIASEAKRIGIEMDSPKLEETMLKYLSHEDETLLSDEGIETLNAYSLKGAHLLQELMPDKPSTREEFLMTFYTTISMYPIT